MVHFTVVACTDAFDHLICPSRILEPSTDQCKKAVIMIHPAISNVPDPSLDLAQDHFFFVFLDPNHTPTAAEQLAGPVNVKTVRNIVEAQLFLESCSGILEAEIMGFGQLLSAPIVARMDDLVVYRTKPYKTDKVFDWIPTKDWVYNEIPGASFDTQQYSRQATATVYDLIAAKSFDESRICFYRCVDFEVVDRDPCSLILMTDRADVPMGITAIANPLTGRVLLEGQTSSGLVRHEFLDLSTHKYIAIGRLVCSVLEALEEDSIHTIR